MKKKFTQVTKNLIYVFSKSLILILFLISGIYVKAQSPYCNPDYNSQSGNCTAYFMSINAVEILDGSTVVYTKAHAGAPNYGCEASAGQYTLLSSAPMFTLKTGKTYSFGFTTGISYAVGVGVWIDLNADNDFADAGEYISTGWCSGSGNLNPGVTSLTYFSGAIPSSCFSGTTRMRIRTTYSSCTGNDNGCTVYNYGEAEDYTITLSSGTNDVGITSLINPSNVCGAASDPFIVQIKNQGSNSISASIPVSMTLSGATSGTYTKTFTRTLASCATDTIHLTTLNTAAMKGALTIKSWTNYSSDANQTNDTNLTSMILYGAQTPMSGTYTIGSTGNFSSIKMAIDSLKIKGLNGNVNLELQNSYSSAGESFPITITKFTSNICGSLNNNPRLTIRPASGATNIVIAGNNATALFILDNAYKVTFDGRPGGSGTSRELYFNNASTTGTVITMQNDAIGNTIRNCVVRSANTNSASGAIFIGASTLFWGNDSNMITNNLFTKSSPTTFLYSAITSSPTSNLLIQNDNISITDNEFRSIFNFGINVVNSLGNGEKWTITNNSFYDSATSAGMTSTNWVAINFLPGTTSNSTANIISNNYIGGTDVNCGGSSFVNSSTSATMAGIRITCSLGTPNLVQGNVIQNISFTNTTQTATFQGINITGGSAIVGGAAGKGNTIGHATTANSISSLSNNPMIGIATTSPNDMIISYNTVANIFQNNIGTIGAVRGIVNSGQSAATGYLYITNNIVKSLSTNSRNGGATISCSVIGIITSSSSNNQFILDNIIGNGLSEALTNYATASYPDMIGIGNTGGITRIKGNKINGIINNAPANGTGTIAAIIGLYHTGVAGGVIENNEIRNLSAPDSTVATQVNGIYCTAATDITNNIVSGIFCAGNNTGTGSSSVITGISFQTALPTTIKNNTIENFNATKTATTEIIGITTASTLTYIQNNIIRNLASKSTSTNATLASIVGIAITPSTANKNITGNKIYGLYNYNTSTASTINGIYMTNTTTFGNSSIVNNNNIHSFKMITSGIGVMTGIYAGTGNVTYQNNMIRLGIDSTGSAFNGPYNVKGIVHASSSSSNYYNNNIYLRGASAGTTNTACFEITSSITAPEFVNVRNNIFFNNISNTSSGLNAGIRIISNSRIFSNYNIFFTPLTRGVTGIINTTGYANLTGSGSWNALSLIDGQSAQINPSFVAPNGTSATVDLHLTSSNPAEGQGDPTVTVVNDDFDGQIRSGLSPNDVGADAGNFTLSADLIEPLINYVPLVNTVSTSDRTFTVNIYDNVGLPISSSANAPRVYYKKGAGTYYSGSGTLSSGTRQNGNWSFTINATTLGGLTVNDVISYYIIAQDSAANIISNPMYAISTNVNTITTDPTTPNTYTIVGGLPTTIQVGAGQTYTALTTSGAAGLFNAINTSGLQGNTVVEITSDLTETGAIALNQWNEIGGSNYTLTIRPSAASRRTVSGTGSGLVGMIRLNGADRVRITGIPSGGSASDTFLFIKTTSTTDPAITLLNDAINNTIENCIVEASPISSGNPSAILLSATGVVTGNDNNTIAGCYIRAINGTGMTNGIQSVGQSPTFALPLIVNDNITIRDCRIYNFTTNAISAVANGAGNNWRILKNHFYRSASTAAAAAQTVINFTPGTISNNDTISGNFIGGSTPNAGGSAYQYSALSAFNGMIISSGIEAGIVIQNNTVKNILLTNTGTLAALFTGINPQGGNTYVRGNTIGDLTTANSIQTNGDCGLIGINSTIAQELEVSNNIVANLTALGGTVYTSTSVRGITISNGSMALNVIGNTVKNLTATSRATGSSTSSAVVGIGVGSAGTLQNILNNTIQNLKNLDNVGAHCMVGLAKIGGGVDKIRGNVVSGLLSSTANVNSNQVATGIMGIIMQSSTGNSECSNNKISDLKYVSATPTSVQIIGLLVNSGTGGSILSNNTISSINSMSISTGTTSSAAIIGLSYSAGSTFMNVSRNIIHSLNHNNTTTANAVNVIGLFFSGTTVATPTVISRNFVHSLKVSGTGASGIYGIYNNQGYATYENNMVRVGIDSSGAIFTGPYTVHGIFQNFANQPCMYYHNSVYVGGSPSSGSSQTGAFTMPQTYSTTTTRAYIKNNIFYNAVSNTGSATGINNALQIGSSNLIYSNNNILFANGTGGRTASTSINYTNLSGASSWQLASGLDLKSGSSDPKFINATGNAFAVDLHLNSSNPAEGNGSMDADVTTTEDFDGNIRSSRTPSDIGAHSGNFTLSSDIIAPVITLNPFHNDGNLSGTRILTNVKITDNVGIPLTGSTMPRIYFSKGKLGTWYSSAATSLSGTSTNATGTFGINYSTMGGVSIGDTINYFIIAQDNAGNLISNNLYAVASDVNTISSYPIAPLNYRITASLAAGTKLRVGTGKTYPTLTGTGGLFEYLNTVSLAGNITAVISSNTVEPGTFALSQLGDNGSGTYGVTIRPDSLTTTERLISGNVGSGMIRLDGSDQIKFTGVPDFNGSSTDKKLRFRNSSTAGQVFLLLNEAVDNRLNNLNIESANSSTSTSIIQFSTSNKANGNSRDTISNCVLGHDPTGALPFIGVPAMGIYSLGDVGKENTANVISGNEITNFSQYGIWLSNVGNGNNWNISNNSLYRNLSFPAFAFQYAIYIETQIFSGGHILSGNFIGGSAKNCGGAPWVNNANVDFRAISFTTGSFVNPSTISNNVIQNIRKPNIGAGNTFLGIISQNQVSVNILNNLIGHPTDINSIVLSGGAQHSILSHQSSGNCNIIGNTVQGINCPVLGVAENLVCIFLVNGQCTVRKNLVGSTTVANSIQNSGTGSIIGIQGQMTSLNAPTVLFDSNTVANMTSYGVESGITLRGIVYGNNGTSIPTITNNTVFNCSVNSSNTALVPPTAIGGIGIYGTTLGGTIANNTVYNLRANNTGNGATCATGVFLNLANNVTISNNRIYDIINLSANTNINAPALATGILVSTPQNVVTMRNNQISLGMGQTNSPMYIGIWQAVSGNFQVNSYFNSIYIGGTATSGVHSSFGYLRGNNYVTSSYVSVVNSKNNIFMNDRKGGTGKHYAFGNQNVITTFQTGWQPNASNFNLLSNTSGNPIGLWNISDYNFSDWKLNSNCDINSLNISSGTSTGEINPANLFQNTAIGNLNLKGANTEAGMIYGKAIPISGITTDFTNLLRNATTPTIGSSEAFQNDVGVSAITSVNNTCGKPATAITVTLKNFGLQSQSNIPVRLVVSGGATLNISEVFTGPLASNATASYTFTGTFNSSLGGTYTVKSFSNLSNEDVRMNDSSTITMNMNPLPKPTFTYSDTCAGNAVKFVSTSTVSGGTITANLWRFGDGGTGTGNSVNRTYATAGSTYTVKIISTSNNGCIDSGSRAVSILTNLNAGVIGSNQTICFNTAPSLITNSSTASGSIGSYNYQWQSSTDSTTYTDISGATGIDYQPGTLTSNRWYRRSVKTTVGCGPSFSNIVRIKCGAVLSAGTIGSPQTICFNGTGSALSFITTPTGAFGTYTYQWQQSTDSSTWSNITGQTGATFTPTNVTSVTYYRSLVTSGSCPTAGTNGIKIKLFSPITGGTIGSGQTVCAGYTPAGFTQISAPSGGPGSYTFQWQSSTDSINWNNISGATSSNYSSPAVSGLTYFQRLAGNTGCPNGTSNALKIRTLAKPNIVFTASNHCFNDPMPLSNTSNISSGTLSYLWKFGDGGTSTSSVPNKTYSSSGTYNVTLVGTSNLGCKDSLTKSVIVATTPLPSFTFVLKCQGDSAIFTDNTVYACGAGSGLVYSWDFGDGTKSNVQNARKRYNSPGTYNVKFKISLPGGFKDSITKTVAFNIKSTPSFTATNNCFPEATSFTNNSTNYASLAWSFGDGTTSATTSSTFTKTYSVAATYNAKLVATSSFGCKDSLVKSINVFSKPKAVFSVSNNCIGTTTNFNNSSSGAVSYSWNFGDGNTSSNVNPSNSYASANTYSVKLKVTSSNGCLDSVANTVTIYPNPVANFTTANVCNGFLSTFTNTSTGASTYSWNFGNGNSSTATNPTYTYPTAGTYTVSLTSTSSNGCVNSVAKSYTVNSSPKALFTGSNACLGNSITFNNTSTGASLNTWNFGDATTSTVGSPSKTYTAAGNYNVKLVVTNTFGCKDSVTNTIVIYAKPVPAFTAANQCLGTAVSFTNQSTGANAYVWQFGDGKSSAATSPTYTYASANTYSVKLVVTSVNSCKDSVTKTITVYPRPSVSFTAAPDPICRGGLMSFTNTTTNGATYNWTFGNSNTSTLMNPTNIYNVSGNYSVKLLSVSSNGCKDSLTKSVTIWPRPVASFIVNNGCTNDNLSFTSNSTGAVGHEWTFGDGNSSTSTNPSKGYTSPSTYSVKLIVTSPNGCKDTTTNSVTVHPRAAVSFTNPSSFCVGLTATFTNTSSLSAGNMTNQWKFGDGNTSSNTNPTNTYASGGNYTVNLTVTTDKGCVNSATSSVLVYSKPIPNFNATNVCAGGLVTFNNTSIGGSTYLWDFGDASTSTIASPTKVYAAAGTYTVKLTATNANSCSEVITRTITIFANPVANFTASDRCIGQSIVFVNTSTGVNDAQWQFGDGSSSNSFNPTYNYSASGTYNVILNVKSINGCVSSVTKAVNVFSAPKASFSVNDIGQCINGNNFVFTDNSTISSGTFTRAWALGDGSTSTAANPTKNYASSGAYNVKLIVTGNNGCKDSAMSTIMVSPKPIANFNINNNSQCYNGHLFSLSDASSISQGSITRVWNLGDGSSIGGINVVKNFTAPGTYTFRLSVISADGCIDSISKQVTVHPSPIAEFTHNNETQCLNGNSYVYTNTTILAGTYSSFWNLGDGSTISTPNASRSYAAAGNYKVTLNVTTPFSCKDSAYYFVRVLPNPSAITISGPTTANNGSTQIYSVASTPGSTYNWQAVNGVVQNNGTSLIQVKWNLTGATGTVTVTEKGVNGCNGNPANYNVTLTPTAGINPFTKNAFAANLYPNPSTDNFTLDVSTGDMVNMVIYDQLGRQVMEGKRFSSTISIDNHNLAAGIYLVKLSTDTGKTTILRFEVKK